MPSPFPGMDPFIEMQEWDDFHGRFIADVADALGARVRPHFVVRCKRRVYVEYPEDDESDGIVDAAAFDSSDDSEMNHPFCTGAKATIAPVEALLAMPEERIETFLTIREAATLQVVTVVEVLSPSNKRPGKGRSEYLEKRVEILQSRANLVELDLLRRGRRLPMKTKLPPGDYYAIISRGGRRPRAEVYAWTVRQRLPAIPIPLRNGEPDVMLELQPVFDARYLRSGYKDTLNYTGGLQTPFIAADAACVEDLLRSLGGD
jgi:hypothetical protein